MQALHGDRLDVLRRAASRWVILEVEDGEGAKTIESAGRLWNEMLAAGGKRDSRVLALGGGERGFEPCDLGAVVALELGELGGERAHDVALRSRRIGLGLRLGAAAWRALLVGAQLLDASAQR